MNPVRADRSSIRDPKLRKEGRGRKEENGGEGGEGGEWRMQDAGWEEGGCRRMQERGGWRMQEETEDGGIILTES